MFYLHLERYSWLFLQQPGLIINILPLTATGRNNSMARHPIFMCIFAKTNRFRNSSICYSLNSLQCEWCFFTICLWLCNPTFELAYNNKLIDWLIDWLTDCWCGCPACPVPVTVANATLNSTFLTPGLFGSQMTFGCYGGHKFPDMMSVKTIQCEDAGWNETLTACDRTRPPTRYSIT